MCLGTSAQGKVLMTLSLSEGFRLESNFVHLKDSGTLTSLPVDEKFWSEGMARGYLASGRLIGVVNLAVGPSHWEIHPDGDELLYLLSGLMDVTIESGDKTDVITLNAHSSYIVPSETWHQTIAREPSTLLFMTPGKDTHRRD